MVLALDGQTDKLALGKLIRERRLEQNRSNYDMIQALNQTFDMNITHRGRYNDIEAQGAGLRHAILIAWLIAEDLLPGPEELLAWSRGRVTDAADKRRSQKSKQPRKYR